MRALPLMTMTVCCGLALLACQKPRPAASVQAPPYGAVPTASPYLGPGSTGGAASGEYGVSRDVQVPQAWDRAAPSWSARYTSDALGYGDPVEDPWSGPEGCIGTGPWGRGLGLSGAAAWPAAPAQLVTPITVARHAAQIGLSDVQLAKIRSDYFATQSKIGEQHWRVHKARLELARLMGESRLDEAAIRQQLDLIARAWAEARKLRIGLLLRTQKELSPEQQAKLGELGARSSRPGRWRRGPGPPGKGRGRGAPRAGQQDPADPATAKPPPRVPDWF